MTFRGHVAGGLVAGVATSSVAVRWDLLSPGDVTGWLSIFGVVLFFALYPDLDTASVPQRWFYRAVFGTLLFLSWREQYRTATLLAILSILPLLDHHRGWTHWRLSPFLVVLLPAYVFAYWRTVQAEAIGAALTTAHVVAATLMAEHGLALVAALVGWYTHLVLDGRFKIFPTGKDHY